MDPWDLRLVPNYADAAGIDVVRADELTAAAFAAERVALNRPCLVQGTCAGWPAATRWADPAYLIAALGDVEVLVRTTPKIEAFGLRSEAADRAVLEACAETRVATPAREALLRLRTPGEDMCFFEMHAGGAIDALAADLELAPGRRFAYVPELPPPSAASGYPRWSAMMYRNSYSDWHFHGGAEAIMCQVVGDKEVLLLPPDEAAWASLVPVHEHAQRTYAVDRERYPRFYEIQPLRVRVAAGDGLFIPVNWWHAVQSRSGAFGVTVATWWASRFTDSMQPASRLTQSREWRRRMYVGQMFRRGTSGGV